MTHEEMIEVVRLAQKRADDYELMLATTQEQLAEQRALREKAHVQIEAADALANVFNDPSFSWHDAPDGAREKWLTYRIVRGMQ